MAFSNEILERAAKDGSIDSKDWSDLVQTVLTRLETNVGSEFPLPRLPATPPATPPDINSSPPKRPSSLFPIPATPLAPSQKENEPPSSPPQSQTFPRTSDTTSSPAPNHSSPGQPPPSEPNGSDNSISQLPQELRDRWDYVRFTLSEDFSRHPPHTIQRLAELILYPKQHHRYLPSYLNALERVVSVSSGTNVFPLPPVEQNTVSSALTNGVSTATASDELHGDESVGGALLTPIPWLQNGSRSVGTSPARAVASGSPGGTFNGDDTAMTTDDMILDPRPISQGELLRQEQEASEPPAPIGSAPNQEHGVAAQVHAAHAAHAAHLAPDGANDDDETEQGLQRIDKSPEPETEVPHARGPETIGMEDTGPQEQHTTSAGHVLDMEAAVGRGPHSPEANKGSKDAMFQTMNGEGDSAQKETLQPAATEKLDSEGDVQVTDVDGMTDEQKQQGGTARGQTST